MALIQSALIWVVYAVVLALLLIIASTFVFLYQKPRDRSVTVTIVSIFTLTSLLATILLLPVDIALISSTTSSKLGRRKDWATDNRVDEIIWTLKIVYYSLYSLDALLCLLVVPFTYFWYEEYDEVATEEGNQTVASRFWGAFRYTILFIVLVVIIFLVGFFVPVAKELKGDHYDLEYFKKILRENRKPILRNLKPSQAINPSRWRTCIDLCSWTAHHHRHPYLHSVHSSRVSLSTSCVNQVCACDICPFT